MIIASCAIRTLVGYSSFVLRSIYKQKIYIYTRNYTRIGMNRLINLTAKNSCDGKVFDILVYVRDGNRGFYTAHHPPRTHVLHRLSP